jgi:Domain of unknown function (DUF4157)
MPEYAQKTATSTTRPDASRARTAFVQRRSTVSVQRAGAQAGRSTLQTALNQTPTVQAIAQLKRALNDGGPAGPETQLSTTPYEQAALGGGAHEHTLQRQTLDDEEMVQGKFETAQRLEEEEEPLQGRFETTQRRADAVADAAPNDTGMPDDLRASVESLSGMDMSGVRVHADSPKPAELDALAYAQGNDIHIGPGQGRHLPHEAWHVVQQRQGRVAPTMQLQGVSINDDSALEAEADRMGAQAAQMKRDGIGTR